MTTTSARSPARMKKHEHSQRLTEAQEVAAAASRPFVQASDQCEHAAALFRTAEAKLSALDGIEATLQTWPPAPPTPEQRDARREAVEELEAARRVVATVQQHREAARVPMEEAQREVAKIGSESAVLIDGILAEEGQASLAALAKARAEAAKLEAGARSIAAALIARKAFREAEPITVGLNTMPTPELQPNPAPYLGLAERLTTDPDATVSL